jgi:hypothetical protein
MRRYLLLLTFSLLAAAVCSGLEVRQVAVGYATFTSQLTAEDSAAVAWLARNPLFTVTVVPLLSPAAVIPACDILWVHLPDSVAYRNSLSGEFSRKALEREEHYSARGLRRSWPTIWVLNASGRQCATTR